MTLRKLGNATREDVQEHTPEYQHYFNWVDDEIYPIANLSRDAAKFMIADLIEARKNLKELQFRIDSLEK